MEIISVALWIIIPVDQVRNIEALDIKGKAHPGFYRIQNL